MKYVDRLFLACKYWFQGDTWSDAYAAANRIVFGWKDGS